MAEVAAAQHRTYLGLDDRGRVDEAAVVHQRLLHIAARCRPAGGVVGGVELLDRRVLLSRDLRTADLGPDVFQPGEGADLRRRLPGCALGEQALVRQRRGPGVDPVAEGVERLRDEAIELRRRELGERAQAVAHLVEPAVGSERELRVGVDVLEHGLVCP